MKKLLLIGGGGHCHSVLDSVIASGEYDEIGIIDKIDSSCLGIPVIGTDDDLLHLLQNGWKNAIVTVGSVGYTETRKRIYKLIKSLGFVIPSVVDCTATIAKGIVIRDGCYIGKQAVVNTGSILNECCIINTGAIVEHDCDVGSFSHISSGTILCGQVKVGKDSHVGAGSVVRQQISIGDSALIGAGSVVVKDVPANVKAYGNPCKVVKQ